MLFKIISGIFGLSLFSSPNASAHFMELAQQQQQQLLAKIFTKKQRMTKNRLQSNLKKPLFFMYVFANEFNLYNKSV